MSLFKTLLLRAHNPLYLPSILTRNLISFIPPTSKENKKPLCLAFKEAVGLCEKVENHDGETEISEFKRNLTGLENEIRRLRSEEKDEEKAQKKIKPKTLSGMFKLEKSGGDMEIKCQDKSLILKELSPNMEMFVRHLFKEGYFKDANFFPRNTLDFGCLENPYARDFIKFAAEKFGKDNQEIAKWLSGSNLRKVALFGCPTLSRKNVFSAKRLRNFFEIHENTVCSKCVLRSSCKFENQSVWKGDTKSLNLAVVMRVITIYAMESTAPELSVPDDVKDAVNQLLDEVVRLSRTVSL